MSKTLIVDFLEEFFEIEGKYTVLDSGIVNVNGNINVISEKFNQLNLTELPIQFGQIDGHFGFDDTNIINLKGFPSTVGWEIFVNGSSNLKSLLRSNKFTGYISELSTRCKEFNSDNCGNLESLSKKYTAESSVLSKKCTDGISTLDGLNCDDFMAIGLNLKRIGTNFTAKYFSFNQFPIPTALKKHTEEFSMLDEIMYLNNKKPLFKYSSTMRRFIQLNPQFNTNQKEPWIKLIQDYFEHKNIFLAIKEFEELYQEPYLKPNETIEIINSDLTMSL